MKGKMCRNCRKYEAYYKKYLKDYDRIGKGRCQESGEIVAEENVCGKYRGKVHEKREITAARIEGAIEDVSILLRYFQDE